MSQWWFSYPHKGDEIRGIYANSDFRFKAEVSRAVRAKRAREVASERSLRIGKQQIARPIFPRPAA